MLKPTFYLLLAVVLSGCTGSHHPLFDKISGNESGVHFNNTITETDSVNILDFSNIYNGGGVGVGDFNRDGLQDIYFAGNQVGNRLYLNNKDFKFRDITKVAGVGGDGKWCRGVSVIDINNDGWPDIYVCATIKKLPEERENLLYINQGLDKDGTPVFKNMAAEYGLNDSSHSTMANFFDYDNDGDLDCYIVVNEISDNDYPNRFRPRMLKGENASTGRLLRNDWNTHLKHAVFTDVSKQAGITIEGYGHSASIVDINMDGWKDIFVSNDYLSNDILYINNHDGTFTDKVTSYFKHTSANAMGNDFSDINNDGLADLVELDMNPEDNYRKKMMLNANSYQTYQNSDYFNYQYQYVRNTLQLNQGPRVDESDSIGDPVFGDIGFYSGIAETDWSWTPMVTDFDNDGFRDIIITNGFPKDVTDHDFVAFRSQAYALTTKKELLSQIPEVKISNYAFRNNGDLTFRNTSVEWGLKDRSFSNGAAYADLDNDGDLDLVVNNINDEAFIYRNNERERGKEANHYLDVRLIGDSLNRNGLGAFVDIYYGRGEHQVWENTPYRGYLSTVQENAHFGLGKIAEVDSVIVRWQNGKAQKLGRLSADKVITVNIAEAISPRRPKLPILASNALFREVTKSLGVSLQHRQDDQIDFNIQKLIPHKFSEYAPALAAGDVDGNGFDDLVCGGSGKYKAAVALQQPNGTFIKKELSEKNSGADFTDAGLLLFDADSDGDLDLYASSGGYEQAPNSPSYQDRLYVNDGKGNFTLAAGALPGNYTSKLCVRAVDYDRDGDLDVFVSGRVEPWSYPKPVSSFLLRNDSRPGQPKFTDVTKLAAKSLINIGLVCDAAFTDFDNDNWPDLILAGEWMPVTFLKNDRGIFKNVTSATGISNHLGLWNSISAGDFDNDGDVDYVAGNQGRNSFYRASEEYPIHIISKDFDSNGSYDAFPSVFLPDQDGQMKEFPAQTRDDIVKQMISMRTKFQNYKTYAIATMDKLFTPDQMKGALRLEANFLSSVYIRNDGNGKFTVVPLPALAQISVLNGMLVDDFDGDGNLDLMVNTNDFGTEVSVGRYDALNGLVLKGDGHGGFRVLSMVESGVCIPGNGKALAAFRGANGMYMVAASQNKGPVKFFEMRKKSTALPLQTLDETIRVKLKNGKIRKQEAYYGASFLSQSARVVKKDESVTSMEIRNSKNVVRRVP